MELCEPLYLSATIKNPRKLLKKLQKSSLPCHFFVLTLSGGMDQLEIYPAYCLQQPFYRNHFPVIVGLAGDYEEAVALLIQIVEDSLIYTGTCNLKAYLQSR